MKHPFSALAACATLVAPTIAQARNLAVPAEYATIQQAIDASSNGDFVLVSPGTYHERITIDGRAIAVIGEAGAAATTIDADYLGTAVTITNATRATTLQSFTITRGRGDYGGGVLVNGGSASIIGNRIQGNLGASFGNGIMLWGGSAYVFGNVIVDNASGNFSSGGGGGGGIGVLGGDGAEIRGNVISRNSTDAYTSGGGIYIDGGGAMAIVGNIITDNTAPSEGGGIAMFNGTDARIENNLITGNRVLSPSGFGGGVYALVWHSRGPFLIGNTFVDNEAGTGSAIYVDWNVLAVRIANNVVTSTSTASAVYCGSFNNVHPPIIMNNDVYAPAGTAYAGLCADVEGADGNFSADPLFVGATDYRLRASSPAIDAGLDPFVAEPLDFDAKTRITDGDGDGTPRVDLGAFEHPGDRLFADGFEPTSANPSH
ncbi:hypothetical protein FHW12_000865 [Dokdonella fugitiva]|uniref:Periplasmic copper-binding protein NosD beta helix domain-containing protein n=1 Tax=Dokdonella fugitiva TaxID=328517 RepID=A0A839F308_9GAMM|nr:right-handed parallel beta-helix repeat-containing protein [Dokdonella fugitiva]MBA8886674.1 hypothetical protein [Dokdonella fugitiva]